MRSPPSSFALISSENEEKAGALLGFCIGVLHLPTPEKTRGYPPPPRSLGRFPQHIFLVPIYTPDGEG